MQRLVFNRSILTADACFFETKSLVNYFQGFSFSALYWYPNSRPTVSVREIESNRSNTRFVFLGHVNESKGVRLLIEASKQLQKHVDIHV